MIILIITIYNYVIFSGRTITFCHHYFPSTVGVTVSGSYSVEKQEEGAWGGGSNSAINWSRFSGVDYGTLFHFRHCMYTQISTVSVLTNESAGINRYWKQVFPILSKYCLGDTVMMGIYFFKFQITRHVINSSIQHINYWLL